MADGPVFQPNTMRYLVYGTELCPSTGRVHYQGYVEFLNQAGLAKVKAMLGTDSVHVEKRKGSAKEASDYCKKDGQFKEFGAISNPGERTDLKTLVDEIHTGKKTLGQILLEAPDMYHLYGRTLEKVPVKPASFELKLRDWQQKVVDICNAEPDDRTVYMVVDPHGGAGKSTLVKHLFCNYGAAVLGGRAMDMYYAYTGQKVICIDIPRSTDVEAIQYGAIEKLKDGLLFSSKYASQTKYYPGNRHVFVFSNVLPAKGVWSEDRVKYMFVDKSPTP